MVTQIILSNEAETQIFSRADGSSGGAITRHVTATDFDDTGSYGRILLVRYLRELLKYDKKRLVYEGTEEVDGVPCERYAFVLGKPPYPIETGLVHRFWIDMGRNGHVLKKERWNRGRLLSTASEITLDQVEIDGQPVWFPAKGTARNIYENEVTSEEHYRVLRGSAKINQGISDAAFSIKYPMGTPISDRLRGVVYEFGQDRRPPPKSMADAQTRLKEALSKAEAAKSELAAASWSRGGWINWAFWGPFSVFLGAPPPRSSCTSFA